MITRETLPKIKEDEVIINNKYWLLAAVILLAAGVFATVITGEYKNQAEISKLLNRVQTIAATFDSEDIKALSGSIYDISSPAYALLKSKMTALKTVNSDARFIYLMGYRNGKLFFFVDSEPVDSEDYSAPGDVYEETTAEEAMNFANKVSYTEGPYTDKWGTWISGYAPIVDAKTGATLAIIGFDINSTEWERDILYAQALPVSLTISALLILLLYYLFQKRRSDIIQRRLEFVSVASHQLRTPLSSIKWSAELILAGKFGGLTEKQKEYLNHVYESSERIVQLLKDLLQASRIDGGKGTPDKKITDLVLIFEAIKVDFLGLLKEHNNEIVYKPGFPQKLLLNIDGKQMREVFANLISNAVKYSKENGKVEIGFEENEKKNIISIKDQGLGITKESQKRIFERFYRAENALSKIPDGNGLGLYIAKDIVEAHGGKLYFESTENVSTTFFVELPKDR